MRYFRYSRVTVHRPAPSESASFAWGFTIIVAVAAGAVSDGWGGGALAFVIVCGLYGLLGGK